MGQKIWSVTKTIVTDTNIYASGDFIGTGLLQLDDIVTIGGARLMSIVVADKSKQSAAIDFLFWSTALAGTTPTNNGALDVVVADVFNFVGGVSMVAGDYSILANTSVGTKRDIHLMLNAPNTGRTIYCTPVARGTPTYAASALQATFVFDRE